MKHEEKQRSGELPELIKQAEAAVTNVKDVRLREIAFEKVLNHLLDRPNANKKTKPSSRSKQDRKKPKDKPKKSNVDGPLAWVTELHQEGFFKQPKSSNDIIGELVKRSHRLKATDLTLPLQTLCHKKKLRRDKQATKGSDKKVFHWFNW